jgi:drug/metabolite transporter (DMT)-like permease
VLEAEKFAPLLFNNPKIRYCLATVVASCSQKKIQYMALDRTTKGVLLGFASFAVFSLSDACVKLIKGQLPPYESAFFGAVFGLTVLPFLLLRKGDHWIDILSTTNLPLWLVRFLAYPMGVIGSVTAFTHLSMAEAFVLIFLQPAYITAMSVFFLKERVGYRRWSAVAIGFLGVLIVLRPGFRPLSIGHLGALFAGLGGAVSVVAELPEVRKRISPYSGREFLVESLSAVC